MRKYFLSLLNLLFVAATLQAFGQNAKQINKPENAKVRVYYDYQHQRDLEFPKNIHREKMLLLLGEKSSYFTSFDKIQEAAKRTQEMDELSQSGVRTFSFESRIGYTPQEFLLKEGSNEIWVIDYLKTQVVYPDLIPTIEWNQTAEEKEIEGMKAIKATTTYLGRNWEVWYTPEIPYSAGPWLLRGLPGLILEAQDVNQDVQYQISHIESADEPQEALQFYQQYEKVQLPFLENLLLVTKEQFEKELSVARENSRNYNPYEVLNKGKKLKNPFQFALQHPDAWIRPVKNKLIKK